MRRLATTVLILALTRTGPGSLLALGERAVTDQITAIATGGSPLMELLTGTFEQQVTLVRGPDVPAFKGTGQVTGRSILQGRFVHLDCGVSFERSSYESWAMIGLDAAAGAFTLTVLDTGSDRSVSALGRYDPAARTLTFEGSRVEDGRALPTRFLIRFRFESKDKIELTYDFDFPGRPRLRIYRARLSRIQMR